MAESQRPPSSLSGVIDEIAALYPELDKNSVRKLFSKPSETEMAEPKAIQKEIPNAR